MSEVSTRERVLLMKFPPAERAAVQARLRAHGSWLLDDLERQLRAVPPHATTPAAMEPCPCGCPTQYRGLTAERRAALRAHPHPHGGFRTAVRVIR